jgi:hypothetical protein
MQRWNVAAPQDCSATEKQQWPAPELQSGDGERQADEEIRTLDPLLGKEMLYH